MEKLLLILVFPIYFVYSAISWLVGVLWKVTADVAKGVYGKFVGWLSALIFAGLLGWVLTYALTILK